MVVLYQNPHYSEVCYKEIENRLEINIMFLKITSNHGLSEIYVCYGPLLILMPTICVRHKYLQTQIKS